MSAAARERILQTSWDQMPHEDLWPEKIENDLHEPWQSSSSRSHLLDLMLGFFLIRTLCGVTCNNQEPRSGAKLTLSTHLDELDS